MLPQVARGDQEGDVVFVGEQVNFGGEAVRFAVLINRLIWAVAEADDLPAVFGADAIGYPVDHPVGLLAGAYVAGARQDAKVIDLGGRRLERPCRGQVPVQDGAADEAAVPLGVRVGRQWRQVRDGEVGVEQRVAADAAVKDRDALTGCALRGWVKRG